MDLEVKLKREAIISVNSQGTVWFSGKKQMERTGLEIGWYVVKMD